jgi:hypothetical protein
MVDSSKFGILQDVEMSSYARIFDDRQRSSVAACYFNWRQITHMMISGAPHKRLNPVRCPTATKPR